MTTGIRHQLLNTQDFEPTSIDPAGLCSSSTSIHPGSGGSVESIESWLGNIVRKEAEPGSGSGPEHPGTEESEPESQLELELELIQSPKPYSTCKRKRSTETLYEPLLQPAPYKRTRLNPRYTAGYRMAEPATGSAKDNPQVSYNPFETPPALLTVLSLHRCQFLLRIPLHRPARPPLHQPSLSSFVPLRMLVG